MLRPLKAFAAGKSLAGSSLTTTTDPFDSTGYTHLVVFTKYEGAPTTTIISDNKGSVGPTEFLIKTHTNNDLNGQFGIMPLAATGVDHTVTVTRSVAKAFSAVIVWLVNSLGRPLTLDVEAEASGSSTAPDAGSLVTTTGTVSFLGVSEYDAGSFTSSAGWTEDYDSNTYGASRADDSGTLNPAATWTRNSDWVACAISLKISAPTASHTREEVSIEEGADTVIYTYADGTVRTDQQNFIPAGKPVRLIA